MGSSAATAQRRPQPQMRTRTRHCWRAVAGKSKLAECAPPSLGLDTRQMISAHVRGLGNEGRGKRERERERLEQRERGSYVRV